MQGNLDANELPDDSLRTLRMSPVEGARSDFDPEVQLYPTIAYPIDRGSYWRIQVHGRLCQNVPPSLAKRFMLRTFIRALDLDEPIVSGPIFSERIHGFLVAPIARGRVQVTIANQTLVLPRKSKSSGLFACKLDIPRKQLQGFRVYGSLTGASHRTEHSDAPECTISCDNGHAQAVSTVFLAAERGVSVISDIDDTIKYTDVCSRRRMLMRTFAEPFEPIHGMASVYQDWADQGALFHYVSSSPWQIYDAVREFLTTNSFPLGSMHLKWFRLRDELFKKWQIVRRKGKAGVISGLIKRMPHRQFVLIGDSGEKDPEMYAKLASKHAKQVVRICIHQIDENPLDASRLNKIYKRYGMTVPIQVFAEANQLGDLRI
jgi:phosphatidate phosphatase APP1